ncbi:MAG: nitroreductase family protein [Chloroflexi bacterium]|nr:nitroreductase family protein [Chloroflexota bacterium]
MDIESLRQLVRTRRSVRAFKADPIPDGHVEQIIEVARWAMSGANAQPWEFVIVKDAGLRGKIFDLYRDNKKHSEALELTLIPELRHPQAGIFRGGGDAFKNAPVIIVVAGDPRTYLATSVIGRTLSGKKTFHMNMGNVTFLVHLAAASLGLGAQWVSAGHSWEGSLKTLLGIPEMFTVPQIVPIGYPDRPAGVSYRRETREIVHHDRYDMSKYRSDEEVIAYLTRLRQRTTPAYRIS